MTSAFRSTRVAIAMLSALVLGNAGMMQAQAPNPPFSVRVVGSGRPMLLIPGLTSSGAVWDGAVAALTGEYQMHVITLAGFAGQPAVVVDSTWMPRMREALVAYIKQQRLTKPVIVGHSLGGFLALSIAATSPALPGAIVNIDGLPFLGATGDANATVATVRPQADAMRKMMVGPTGNGGNIEAYARMQTAQLKAMIRDTTMIPAAAEMGRTSDLKTVAEAMHALYTTDLRPDLGAIKAPVLNLHSWVAYKGYGMTRERADSMFASQYRTLTTGETRVHDAAYHFIMYDEPAWMLAEMRRFLAAHK